MLQHTPDSRFTAYSGSWDALTRAVECNWEKRKPGYRDGVVTVPIRGDGFFTCPTILLCEDDIFEGAYVARHPGETPRKTFFVSRTNKKCVVRKPSLASHVDVVLYSRETLAENDEERTGADWDIITILGKIREDPQPMSPETLMANHFGADGGTNTHMTPEEFEASLRESFNFWQNKGLLG